MKISRSMGNLQIAKLLRSVSAALVLSNANRFRVIAYDKAADAIEHASSEVKDLWDDGKLKELSGIGEGIASSLDELFKTGKVKHFEEILKPYPEALFELMEVPGIGPKNALKFCKAFGITKAHTAVTKLEKAAKSGLVAKLEGFGPDSQTRVLQGISELSGRSKRLLLDQAHTIAGSLITYMKKNPHIKKIDYLGSLRRQASTVGDLDFSVATDNPKDVIEYFCKYPNKSRVLEAGDKSASLILPGDHQADLMVQPPEAYGSLLQHFTGSKHHNIALRELALKKGYSLSEHGIRPLGYDESVKPYDDPKLIKIPTEEKFYKFLGLDWIPPELREGKGEIEAAGDHKLPKLVEVSDIKGDLQLHSNFPIEPSHDLGQNSPGEIAKIAKSLGYEYIGLTDHNPAISGHTEKQIIDLVKKRSEAIRSTKADVHIFVGLEIDIQPGGELALPEAAFDHLDYACVSIHSSFRQTRDQATTRVLRALDHPKVRFLAHPTGRLLGEREGVELDWDQIFDYCLKNNKWLEIDGWPNRLDLPDVVAHDAIKRRIKLVVNTDSHAASQLPFMKYGVAVARRAWATQKDIINTMPLSEMKKMLV